MKKLLAWLIIGSALFLSCFAAFAQKTPSQFKTDVYNNIRTQPYAPSRAGDAFDAAVNASKSFYIDGTASGTNTYSVTVSNYAMTAYVTGQSFRIQVTNANSSGTITMNVTPSASAANPSPTALGAIAVKGNDGNDLAVGDLKAGGVYDFFYNGTNFRCTNVTGSGGAGGGTVDALVAGNLIDVDATDPANPVVAVETGDKGDITIGSNTLTIDNNAVTFAKMQAITDNRLLGAQGGTAVEEISLTANDFDLATNAVSIDYANGQAATSGQDGFLQSSDWTTFNNKTSTSDVTGTQDLFISAAAMWPRTTAGCAALAQTELSTSIFNIQSLDFDQSTDEFAQFQIALPRKWNNGTVTVVFYWTAATGSGDVIWTVNGGAYSDDDALTVAFGTAQSVTDGLTATNDLMISSATSAVTIAGTPADADFLAFQVSRDADNGSDTLTGDAKLLGISIRITTDAAKDN